MDFFLSKGVISSTSQVWTALFIAPCNKIVKYSMQSNSFWAWVSVHIKTVSMCGSVATGDSEKTEGTVYWLNTCNVTWTFCGDCPVGTEVLTTNVFQPYVSVQSQYITYLKWQIFCSLRKKNVVFAIRICFLKQFVNLWQANLRHKGHESKGRHM